MKETSLTSHRSRAALRHRVAAAAVAFALIGTFAGCAANESTPTASESLSASTPKPTPKEEASDDKGENAPNEVEAQGEIKANTDKLVDPSTGQNACEVFTALRDLNAQIADLPEEQAQTRYGDLLRLTGKTFEKLSTVDDDTGSRPDWKRVGESATKAADALAVFGGDAMNATSLEALGQLNIDYDTLVTPRLGSIQERCDIRLGTLAPSAEG